MATTRTQAQIQSDINNNQRCPGVTNSSLVGVSGDRVGDGPNDLDWYGYKVICSHCQTWTRVKVVSARWNNNGFSYPEPTIVSSSISGTTANVTINVNVLGQHTKSTTINHKTYSVPSTLTNELNEARARDNAVSSFDSLYTTASRATSSSTLSSNISTLNSYLNTIRTYAGTSSSYYTSRSSQVSSLNNKLTTLRNQESAAAAEAQRNTNANNAASSFDSLYNSISGNISNVTSDNLSSLQAYLNTISSNSSTSDSRYTTRKTKYDTLNNKKNALDAAITAFDNLNLNTTPNNTTAAEAKRQLDIILTNAGSNYEGYTSRLAKYNTYVANLSTTEQLNISVGSLRELHTNISGTMLPGKVSRYTDIYTRGTEGYNTTKTCIEKLLNSN